MRTIEEIRKDRDSLMEKAKRAQAENSPPGINDDPMAPYREQYLALLNEEREAAKSVSRPCPKCSAPMERVAISGYSQSWLCRICNKIYSVADAAVSDVEWSAEVRCKDMAWTTEYPTKPGFYWIRNYAVIGVPDVEPEPSTVYVAADYPDGKQMGDLEFYFAGNPSSWAREELASAEWYGPIEPPE
jgi:hypothetical protein